MSSRNPSENNFIDKVGGGLRALHGFGENVRGSINGIVDQTAQRNAGPAGTTEHGAVAQRGLAEMQEGFDRMAGRPKQAAMADAQMGPAATGGPGVTNPTVNPNAQAPTVRGAGAGITQQHGQYAPGAQGSGESTGMTGA